jgi:DNA polymerase III alpha subunit
MNINQYGLINFSEQEVFEKLYTIDQVDLSELFIDSADIINQFNKSVKVNADNFEKLKSFPDIKQTIHEFDKDNQTHWFMPADYCPNLVEMLYGMCETDQQRDRVSEELELFIEKNMLDLLFYLKYLVDTMRKNKIVWGVGRGSSVSSYILYLIGVHKIDSLKYNLDIKEFLK